jgi:hypothetical protein
MIKIVTLLNFLLVNATIMKEEIMSALYMILIIISCIYLLYICIGILLLAMIHSCIKSQCIGRKLYFDITCWILYGVHYYALKC